MNIYESKNAVKRTLQTLAFATMVFGLLTGCAPATPSATETPIATETEITDADIGESVSVTPTAMKERWEIRTSEDAISEEFLSGTGRVGVELEIDYPQGADDRVIFEAVGFEDDNGNLVVVMGNLWKKVDGNYVQLKEIRVTVDGVPCIEYKANESDALPIMRFILDEDGNIVEVVVINDLGQEFKLKPGNGSNKGAGVLMSMVNLESVPLITQEMAEEWREEWCMTMGEDGKMVVFDVVAGKGVWKMGEAGWERVEAEPMEMIDVAIEAFGLNSEREYVVSEDGQYLVDTHNQANMAKWVEGRWEDTTLEEKYGHLAPVLGTLDTAEDIKFEVREDGAYELKGDQWVKIGIPEGVEKVSFFEFRNGTWYGYGISMDKFDNMNFYVPGKGVAVVKRAESGDWVNTTFSEKSDGRFAPKEEDYFNEIFRGMLDGERIPADFLTIKPIATGNYIKKSWNYSKEGMILDLYLVQTVMRDATGQLNMVYVYAFSDDLDAGEGFNSNKIIHVKYRNESGDGWETEHIAFQEVSEVIDRIKPGMRLGISFLADQPSWPPQGYCDRQIGLCNTETVAAYWQYIDQEEQLQRFISELLSGRAVTDTSDFFIPTDWFNVFDINF